MAPVYLVQHNAFDPPNEATASVVLETLTLSETHITLPLIVVTCEDFVHTFGGGLAKASPPPTKDFTLGFT